MHTVVFVRHGESEYNALKKCAGWLDCRLTSKGIAQARKAGQALLDQGYTFDVAYSSTLKRAVDTRRFLLEEMGLTGISTPQSWRLNERHYGGLDDLTREEAELKFGLETLRLCRQDFEFRPPSADKESSQRFGIDLLGSSLPKSESMNDAVGRSLDYWHNVIVPVVASRAAVLVVAHGELLRLLTGFLLQMGEQDIVRSPVLPNATPLVFEFNDDFTVSTRYFLPGFGALSPIALGAVDATV